MQKSSPLALHIDVKPILTCFSSRRQEKRKTHHHYLLFNSVQLSFKKYFHIIFTNENVPKTDLLLEMATKEKFPLSLLGLPHIQKKGLHTSKRTSRPSAVYPENRPQKKSMGFPEGASLWAMTSGAQGPRSILPPPDHRASESNYPGPPPPSLGARPPKARAHAVSFSRLSRGSPERNLARARLVANLSQTESVPIRLAAAHTRVSIPRPTAAWGLRPVQARRTPVGLGELRP